ncbi:hypothetical protein EHQ30_18165 [Leptospira brenneri]|uniref:Uncharacterized protein n=1 Tax=Leptospira brenneri TaxID=2023182 RepID=A0A5F1Z5E7_9LEPT|nr:hypothetical protein [Leptospira brenneri]TGK92104.1 hypothetical protein EHQ30_18165 [Leptospira brenneri]
MLEKMKIFPVVLFVLCHCTNLYSPMGIKGKDAKKQLEEVRSNLSLVSNFGSFSLLLTPSSSALNSYTCSTENTAVSGFVTPTTGSNFDFPSLTSYVDLSVTAAGTYYFRSNVSSSNQIISGKILKTKDTSTSASCFYSTSSVCGNTDLSGVSYNSSISTMMSVSAGSCFAIRCTSPAYIRLKQYNLEMSGMFGIDTFLTVTYGPFIFESIAQIGEETYYTKESFEKCKREIVNYAAIEIQNNKFLTSLMTEASNCHKPTSQIQESMATASRLTTLMQADVCNLEPVNLIGF